MKTSPAKAIVAAVGGFLTVLTAAFADDVFGGDDWSNVAAGAVTLALTVYGVYQTRNKPVS